VRARRCADINEPDTFWPCGEEGAGGSQTSGVEGMIDMRWVVKPDTTTEPPKLQFRYLRGRIDASGAYNVMPPEWSEWIDVPREVVPE
jgi:hypothetical protein